MSLPSTARNSLWLLVLLWTSFTCMSVSVAATVKPGITLISDNKAVYLGDSVIVDVEAVGLTEPLDVSELFKFADLLRETTGTRIAVIEGRVVEVKLRRMEFIPRQEGQAIFGPLNADSIKGPVTSNTVLINVLPPVDTNWQPDRDDFSIAYTFTSDAGDALLQGSTHDTAPLHAVSDGHAYVGQHIIADITLKHRHPIFEEQLTLPSFEGFDVLMQYEQRRTIEELAPEDSWRVIAWRFHLFPQRSGPQLISGIQWQGTAVKSRTQRSTFDQGTAATPMMVLPALNADEWWLPATAVSLSEQWSKDPKQLSAGDEIVRIITLTADNTLVNHLPLVTPLESRALSRTLIDQKREQQIIQGTIKSTATFTYRMVAQSPIPVFLDTVRVPWFDIQKRELREAIIPARRINVGLPDRADLLADIALQGNQWDTLTLWIQSNVKHWIPLNISLALLALGCLMLGLREWVLRRRLYQRLQNTDKPCFLPDL